MKPSRIPQLVLAVLGLLLAPPLRAQAPTRPLTEMELSLLGVNATLEDLTPVVPKGLPSAVRVVVRAGTHELSAAEVRRFLGDQDFQVHGELSGPGLQGVLPLPEQGQATAANNSLVLALPPIPVSGDYELGNLRLEVGGRAVLDVEPRALTVKIIDQILVTRVTTRPLTLDEIHAHGIALDSDDYLGFEFNLGLRLESTAVDLKFPVVFDRNGVVLPLELVPPGPPLREGIRLPYVKPILFSYPLDLSAGEGGGAPMPTLPSGGGVVSIPGLLVIPGDVGYLKQFFSAKLYVANGAPEDSGLSVRDVRARIQLPPGLDGVPGTSDDPLALPDLLRDGQTVQQPVEMNVLGLGPDGEPGTADDEATLQPHDEAQAEFMLRGEREGFHPIEFELKAVLDGLPGTDGVVRPVDIVGKAGGGVLVRNPYFDMTFTVPGTVRVDEPFKVFVTVSNIGQGAANDFSLNLDSGAMSGLRLVDPNGSVREVATLPAGDAVTFEFNFVSERTGQIVAKYLKLEGGDSSGSQGHLRFTLAVDERGVPLSPDTLQLPAAVSSLPPDLVQAAMRVLGQAWSVAKAPTGSLPQGVRRIDARVVVTKALALAEAGLRVQLGASLDDALRDLVQDLYRFERPTPTSDQDQGFDQLLRTTEAGRNLARVLGARLLPGVDAAGGPLAYEGALAEIAASSSDFVSFAVDMGSTRSAEVALLDAFGGASVVSPGGFDPELKVRSAALYPLGAPDSGALLGFVSVPQGAYLLELRGESVGTADLAVTLPAGDGQGFRRVTIANVAVQPGSRALVAIDLAQPQHVLLSQDLDGNGVPDGAPLEYGTGVVQVSGPRLVAAAVIGTETFSAASQFGMNAALIFDRAVDKDAAAETGHYSFSRSNGAAFARRQLSGRLVMLLMAAPEGPHEQVSVGVDGLPDTRGNQGQAGSLQLGSRIVAPGGVVAGRVIEADGTPVAGGSVFYLNTPSGAEQCVRPVPNDLVNTPQPALAELPLEGGAYELRYVRQHETGCPFYVVTVDPRSGARRFASARVRGDGDRLSLDIVLFGAGSVQGQVRNRVTNVPVAGAKVVALSNDDPQSGGQGLTDAGGFYSIPGLTVGPVTVRAAKGIGTGIAAGRITHAGATDTIDVLLDDGAGTVAGTVYKLEDGDTTAAAGALVVAYFGAQPVAYRWSDAQGRYRLTGLPTGTFSVTARYEGLSARQAGALLAGQVLEHFDLVAEVPAEQVRRDVAGHVFFADGQPAGNTLVSTYSGSTAYAMTQPDGAFLLHDVVVPTTPQTYTVSARSVTQPPRVGAASYQLTASHQVPADVRVTLGGLGRAVFTAVGPDNQPVAGLAVSLLGVCANACGCSSRTTDQFGRATFEGLPMGHVSVQAFWQRQSYTDFAASSVTLANDGETVFGVLRFHGVGSVRVRVEDPAGEPAGGSVVTLATRTVQYLPESHLCGLLPAQRPLVTSVQATPGNPPGEVLFRNVLVAAGEFRVSATNPNAPGSLSVAAPGMLTHSGQSEQRTIRLAANQMAGELSGQVFLPDGSLAGPGVVVTLRGAIPDYEVETDDQGAYHFAAAMPAGVYTLKARDPEISRGLGVSQDAVALPVDQDQTFDIHLLGRGRVRVSVVDSADNPVASAKLTLKETGYPNGSYERTLQPAHQGVVEFPSIYEGAFSVEAKDSFGRGGRVHGVLPAAGETVEAKLRLSATGCIQGRFVMPNGSDPIPYGVVKLLQAGSAHAIGQATTAGSGPEAGSFSFDYVPFGAVRLEAQDPLTARIGIAAGTVELDSHLGDPQPQCLVLEVRAESLGTVTGTVSSNGLAAPGVEVQVVSGRYRIRTASDQQGVYRVVGVPAGQVVATAKPAASYLSGSASGVLHDEGETLPLDVALHDSVEVAGTLLAADGQGPGGVAEIRMSAAGWWGPRAYSDAEGHFTLANVPVGVNTFDADVLQSIDVGRLTVDLQPSVPPAPVAVELRLNGVGALTGVAQDGAGNPVEGRVLVTGLGDFPFSYTLLVGPTGEFELPQVLAGPLSLRLIAKPGALTLYGSATVEVPVNGSAHAVVQLQASGTVRGRILRAGGQQPAYGAQITLDGHPAGSLGFRVVAQADADGRFEVPGVPASNISGRVRDPLTGGIFTLETRALAANEVEDYGDVVLDDSAPQVTFVTPAAGSVQAAFGGPLVVGLSDPGGIDTSSFSVTYPNGVVQPSSFFTFAGGQASGALIGVHLQVGSNRLRATVKDTAGNVATSEIFFTITGGSITGHVALPGNLGPAAGVPVRVGSLPAIQTDTNGDFVQTGLRASSYQVVATDPATGLSVSTSVTLADGQTHATSLVLPSYGRLSGVVKHPGGAFAEGVTVKAGSATATSDGSGHFDLGALPLGTYTLNATLPNGDRGSASAQLVTLGAPVAAEITLNGIGAATVTVEDASAQRIAGAHVKLTSAPLGTTYEGDTNANGQVSFSNVLAGSLTAVATSGGLTGQGSAGLADGGHAQVLAVLEPAARIAGTVFLHNGQAAPGAAVTLSGVSQGTATAGPAGEFAFENVRLGAFTVDASLPNGDRGRTSGTHSVPGATVPADVHLAGLGTVEVTVTNAQGPVEDATVTLTSSRPFATPRTLSTNASGLASFADVFAGGLTVKAQAGNSQAQTTATLAPEQTLPVAVTLQAVGAIEGHVLAPDGEAKVPGVHVRLGGWPGEAVTDADGFFRFENLALRSYRIEALVGTRVRGVREGVEVASAGQTVTADVTLVGVGQVSGVVRRSGSPVSGAAVVLQSQAPVGGGVFIATTSGAGSYTLTGVPVGTFSISATQGGDRDDATGAIASDGEQVTTNLDLLPATVTLPLALTDGNALQWQVRADGSLSHGGMFESAGATPRLTVVASGVSHAFANDTGNLASSEQAKREVVLSDADVAGLRVTRKVFVPVDGYFVRTLDVLENPGAVDVSVDVLEELQLGLSPALLTSASGDATLTPADTWITLDDADASDIYSSANPGGEFAPLGLSATGAGGQVPDVAGFSTSGAHGTASYRWNAVSVPAGGRVAFLQIFSAQADRTRAQAAAERLSQLPPEVLVGLSTDEGQAVRNFQVPADLVGTLPALPLNDGKVSGTVLAFDGTTLVKSGVVTLRSQSPYHGRPLQAAVTTNASTYSVQGAPANGTLVPRAAFDVSVAYTALTGRTASASASGDLAGAAQATQNVVFTGTGLVAGRVLKSDATTPLVASQVQLKDAAGAITQNSAADGSFLFPVVVPGTFTLEARHPLASPTIAVNGVVVAADARTEQNVVFPASGQLRVLLRTAADAPVGGSLQLTGNGLSRSLGVGPSGVATFTDVPAGDYTLAVTDTRTSAPFLQLTRAVAVTADVTTDELVAFPVSTSLQVTVSVGPARLKNAAVSIQNDLYGPAFWSKGLTNDAGQLTVPARVHGPHVRVRVTHPQSSFQTAEQAVEVTTEDQPLALSFTLPGVGSVNGTLRSRDGVALAGNVTALSIDGASSYATDNADATGAFALVNVPVGALRLQARDNSFPTGRAEIDATLATNGQTLNQDALAPLSRIDTAGERELWTFQAQAGQSTNVQIAGLAYGSATALASPVVEIYTASGTPVAVGGSGAAAANRTFTPATSGTYVALARASSSQLGGYRLFSSQATVIYRTATTGRIVGHVRRGAGGPDVIGQTVRLKSGAATLATRTTDASGFAFELFPASGSYTLEAVEPDGVVSGTASAAAPAIGEDVSADVTVPARGDVHATVLRGADPLGGLLVTFASSGNPDALPADSTRTATTAVDGTTSSVSLPVGELLASVVDPYSGQTHTQAGTLSEGTPLGLTIVLPDVTAQVSGHVFARDGVTPLPGATVTLSGQAQSVETDAAGAYVFESVVPGAYTLDAVYGSSAAGIALDVLAPATQQDLTLDVRIVSGRVTEVDGLTAVAGAAVEACGNLWEPWFQWTCVSAQTGPDGAYAIFGLPPWAVFGGTAYTDTVYITAWLPDADWVSAKVEMPYNHASATTLQADLSLPATGDLSGVVHEQGLPVPGATVSVTFGDQAGPDLVTDGQGEFALARALAGEVRVYAEEPVDRLPGLTTVTLDPQGSVFAQVDIVPSATLSGIRLEQGAAAPGSVEIAALHAPAREPRQVWRATVEAPEPAAEFSRRVPAGPWRVVAGLENCPSGVGADEGRVEAGQLGFAQPNLGTHVCHVFANASGFMTVAVPTAESYPAVGREAQGVLRGLRVMSGEVQVRTQHFTPGSAEFTRTLTAFTNDGGTPALLSFDARLDFADGLREAVSSSDPAGDGWTVYRDSSNYQFDDVVTVLGGLLPATARELHPGTPDEGAPIPGHVVSHYTLEVPAGETRSFLAYTFTRPYGDDVESLAQQLLELSAPEALSGLTQDERDSIVNFDTTPVPLTGVTVGDAGQPVQALSALTDPEALFGLTAAEQADVVNFRQ